MNAGPGARCPDHIPLPPDEGCPEPPGKLRRQGKVGLYLDLGRFLEKLQGGGPECTPVKN